MKSQTVQNSPSLLLSKIKKNSEGLNKAIPILLKLNGFLTNAIFEVGNRGQLQPIFIKEIKRKVFFAFFAFLFLMSSSVMAQLGNVPVTGFNNDIVANGIGAGNTVSTGTLPGVTYPGIGVDGNGPPAYSFVDNTYKWYSGTASFPTCGLPATNLISSSLTPGLTYTLQSYSANNSLTITSNTYTGSVLPTSGTFNLSTPASFTKLYVLYETVLNTAGPTITATVTFTDASTQVFSGNTVVNWFTNTSSAYTNMTRAQNSAPGLVGTCGSGPYLFQMTLNLDAANFSKTVQSISFNWSAAVGTAVNSVDYFHAMAVGGLSACATPAFQPTAILPVVIGATQVTASFTAATGSPAGYLTVRYPSGATPVAPVDGTTYTAGQALGSGTVVQASNALTYTATGLSLFTTYDFYTYSYNSGATCGGPIYYTSSPLPYTTTTVACGNLSGTLPVGPGLPNDAIGGWTSITNALNYVNALGLGGNLILELQSGYDGSAANETFPLTFPFNSCLNSSAKTITIQPASGATGLSIINTTAAQTFNFNGASYVTIDGRPGGTGGPISVPNTTYLTIKNTLPTGVVVQMINDANNITIKYCDLQGQNTTSGALPGVAAGVVFIGTTTGVNGNDNNTIDNCNIHSTLNTNTLTMGVYSFGPAASAVLIPTFNDNNTLSNNNIYDIYGGVNLTTAGIELEKGTNAWTITGNSFFQTINRTPVLTASVANRGIYVNPINSVGVGNGFTITGNYFGGMAPQCGGNNYSSVSTGSFNNLYDAIFLAVSGGATSNIKSNTINNFNIAQAVNTSDLFHAIWVPNIGNVNIGGPNPSDGNIVGTSTAVASTTTGITLNSGGACSSHMIIVPSVGIVSTNVLVQNNKIGGITLNGNGMTFSALFCNSSATVTFDNNLVGSTTIANSINATNTGTTSLVMRGINIASGSPTCTITNNTIANLTNASASITSGSQTGGIIVSAATSIIPAITGNTIFNLSCASAGTGGGASGTVEGIASISTTATACTISNNTISNLLATSASTTAAIIMQGIFYTGNTTVLNTISGNTVHSLNLTALNPTLSMRGIESAAGTNNVFNNIVRLGVNAAGADITTPVSIYGMIKSSTAVQNFYHNSVYIGGSGVTAGTQPSYAFWRINASSTNEDVKNNIFVNARSGAGAGKHYAVFIAAGQTANLSINNNIYQAIGTNGVFAFNGTADVSIYLPSWIVGDVNSWNNNPQFINSTGSSATLDLHINPAIASPVEGLGINIPLVTTDIDGQTRSGLTPVDIGADAGNFTAFSACVTPADQPGPLVLTPISLTQINGSFTTAPSSPDAYIVVKYNSGATPTLPLNGSVYVAGSVLGAGTILQVSSATTFSATGLFGGTSYDFYVYSFNKNCIGGPLYNLNTPLIGSQSTNTCAGLSGIVPIGPGQPNNATGFTSLTNAMTFLNANGLAAATILELQPGYLSSVESFPVTIGNISCAGPVKTLTIRPAGTVVSPLTITSANTTATIDINGGNYVIIDGRPGGTGSNKYLIVENTTTTAASAGNAILIRNEASLNTITYCEIRSANANIPTNTALTTVGSIPGAIAISTTTGNFGNDNNIISFCDIHSLASAGNLGACIYAANGTTAGTAANNDNCTIDNCNIYDFYLPTSATAGIDISLGNNNWTISNNHVYQTASRSFTTGTQAVRGFWITPNNASLTSASGFTITGNYIGGNASNGTGSYVMTGTANYSFRAMDISVGFGTTSSIQNNTLTNWNITGGFTGNSVYGIDVNAGNVNIGTVTGNLIGSTTTNGAITLTTTVTGGSIIGLRSGHATLGTINFSNNIVSGIDVIGSATTIVTGFNGIAGSGGANITVNNNTIGSATLTNSINMISTSSTATTAAAVRGIINNSPATGVISTITNNLVANINTNYSATGAQTTTLIGIILTTGTGTISGNTVRNLSSNTQTTSGGATAGIVGIGCTSTTAPIVISGNTIHTLKLTNPTTAAAVANQAIAYAGPTTGVNIIEKNTIHSLSIANPTNAAAILSGMDIASGLVTIKNNMIRLGLDETGASIISPCVVRGISKNVASSSIYHNSIYIGGTGVGTTATNTYAIIKTAAPAASDDWRNNIFVNNRSNATTGGKHYAINLNAVTLLTLDYNDYYGAGTGYVFGSTGVDVGTYSSNWVSGDVHSYATDPMYINPNGTAANGNLHIDPVNATIVEATGTLVASVVDDFDGQTRGTLTPTDLGADAGNFVNLLCNGTPPASTAAIIGSATPLCLTGTKTLTLSGFSASPGMTYQWQESTVQGGPYTNVTGGSGGTTITFTTPTITQNMYYICVVTCSNGGAFTPSSEIAVVISNPQVLTTTPASICGIGSATLCATVTPGSSLSWFTVPTGGTSFGFPYTAVAVTGFNNDVVATGVGTNTIEGTTYPTIGLDGQNYTFIDNTFKYVSTNALPTCFMPINNLAPSSLTPGLTYQFQSYTSNNALSIANSSTTYTSPLPSSGTLTLSTPASFGNLRVLYESVANAPSTGFTVDAVVTFTDATTQTFAGNTCVNWFTVTNPTYSGMGRTTPAGAIQCGTTPNMFELQLPISNTNYAKLVQSITFSIPTLLTTGTTAATVNYFHAMAVGGNPPPPSSCLTTPVLSVTTPYYVQAAEGTCISSTRTLVNATVSAAPTLSISANQTVCANAVATLQVTSPIGSYTTFNWSPTTNLYLDAAATIPYTGTGDPTTVYMKAAPAGNYTISLNASDGTCNNVATSIVTVDAYPTITSAVANPGTICLGSSSTLTALTGTTAVLTSQVGTGTSTTTGSTIPFYRTFEGSHHQYLYTKAELSALGFTAGNFTRIQIPISAITVSNGGNFDNFGIRMANTSATTLTAFQTPTFTNVFSVASYTPSIGNNPFVFSTPFVWDGVSNVLLDMYFDNDPTSSCSGCWGGSVTETTTTTTFTSVVYFYGDNLTTSPRDMKNITTITSSSTIRPNFIFDGTQSSVGAGNYIWQWNPGAIIGNVVTVIPGGTTTYTVSATTPVSGCTSTANVIVNVNPLPTPPTSTSSTQCGLAIPTASVTSTTGAASPVYNWYSAAAAGTLLQSGTSATYLSAINATTTFYVSEINPITSCESFPRTTVVANVTNGDLVAAQASINNTIISNICLGGSFNLAVVQTGGFNNPYTYSWSTTSGNQSGLIGTIPGGTYAAPTTIQITPTAAGTYVYNVSYADGSCSNISSVTVIVNGLPTGVTAASSANNFCGSGTFNLTATGNSGGATTLFTDGFETFPSANLLANGSGIIASSNSTYYAAGSKSVLLEYTPSLTTANTDNAYVQRTNTSLIGYASAQLTFSHIAALEGASTAKDVGYVQYSVDNGVNWITFPTSSYAGSGALITTSTTVPSITGTAFSAKSYTDWNTQFNSSSATPGTSPATSLWKNETINIPVTAIGSALFKVRFMITSDASVSYYGWLIDNVQIKGTSNLGYSWISIPSGFTSSLQNPTGVTASVNTNYIVVATSTTGCTASASVPVVVTQLPAAPTASAPSTQCGQAIPMVSVSSNIVAATHTYKWYDAPIGGNLLQTSTSPTYTSIIYATTNFYVTEVAVSGCESFPRVLTVANVTQPDAVTIVSNQTSCIGSSIAFSVNQTGSTNNYVYTWSATPSIGSGISGTPIGATQSFTPTSSGNYVYLVIAYDAATNCTTQDTQRVQVYEGLTGTVSATQITSCANTTGLITANVSGAGTVVNNDFSSTVLPANMTSAGNDFAITGGQMRFTTSALSKNGGVLISNPTGLANNDFQIDFDMITTAGSASPADGFSYSYGPDVVALPTGTGSTVVGTTVAPNATNPENGSGSALKLSFDAYTNGANTAGVYLMYNCPVWNQLPTSSGVIFNTANTSWRATPTTGANTHVTIKINSLGQVSMFLNAVQVVTNQQLPASYLTSDKSTWKHAFCARTGGEYEGHFIDNLIIQYNNFYEYSINGGATWTTTNPIVPPGPGTYSVDARYVVLPTCAANLGSVTINTLSFNAAATSTNVCASSPVMPTLSFLPAFAGATYQWESSAAGANTWTDVIGATAVTLVPASITANTDFRCKIYCGGVAISGSPTNLITINYVSPAILSTTPASRCGAGTLNLQATGSSGTNLQWYNAASGGTAINAGNSFTTPAISSSTTFYVASSSVGIVESAGKPAPITTDNVVGNQPLGLSFNVVNKTAIINSVKVYSVDVPGSLYVELWNSTGTVLQTAGPFSYGAGSIANPTIVTLPLNFVVSVGTGYRLLTTQMVGGSLIREPAVNNVFPYNSASGNISVTGGYVASSGASTAYYYLYNWQVQSVDCESARTPVLATVTPAPTVLTFASSSSICQGSSTTLSATSSNDPHYLYTWTPGGLTGASVIVSPTVTTTYTVTALDTSTGSIAGCQDIKTITITVNSAPTTPTIAQTPLAVCQGSPVTLTASPVIAGVSFLWSTGETTSVINPTPPSGTTTYSITATSTLGCTSSSSINVTSLPLPQPKISQSDTLLCFPNEILLYAIDTGLYSGGYPAGTTVDWIGIVNGLSPSVGVSSTNGSQYQARVVLPNGCNASSPIVNIITRSVTVVPVITPAACGNNSGKVVATITAGTAPFHYLWTDGVNTLRDTVSNTIKDSVSGLAPSTYYLTIYDHYGQVVQSCNSGSIPLVVPGNPPLVALISTANNVSCNGAGDGSATVSTTGGSGTYSYIWSSGQFSASIFGLSGGTYTVTVTDQYGCSDTAVAVIVEPNPILIGTNETPVSCFGGSNGSLTANVSGGTAPYIIDWYDANFTYITSGTSLIGQPAGSYFVVVTDMNSCFEFLQTTITEPAAVSISGFVPTSGSIGTPVIISGGDFTGTTAVLFNGVAATSFTVDNNGQITAIVPSGASTGTITVVRGICNTISTGVFTYISSATLNLTAMIEGYYDVSTSQMVPALVNQGIAAGATECDTISVELHDQFSPLNILATVKTILHTNGQAAAVFPGALSGGSYYIVIKHRNAVQTWSALPVSLSAITNYNFTTSATQAYGANLKNVGGVWTMFSGDINPQDEFVDASDLATVDNDATAFAFGYFDTDVNGDGYVDASDLAFVDNNATLFIYSTHP